MREYVVDITRKGVAPVVQVTEFDSMSRYFTLILMDGGVPFEEPEGATYSVFYETQDGKGWYDTITLPDSTTRPAVSSDGNEYTVEIAEAATTACGELALCITAPGGYQLTVAGIITRSADIPGYDGEEVENYYNVYITRMEENAARAENAADIAVAYGATVEVDEDAQQLNITHHSDTEGGVGWLFGSAVTNSASGAVAAIPDGANDVAVKSLIAEITPVQSGSGDPSPTNVRAISGRTGMTVTRAGKNVLHFPFYRNPNSASVPGLTITEDNGVLTINGTASTGADYQLYSPYYDPRYLSIENGLTGSFVLSVVGNVRIAARIHNTVTNANRYESIINGEVAFSTGENEVINNIYLTSSGFSGTYNNAKIYPMLRYANISDSTFEPYTATEYPITWQTQAGTIYGGTLNVTTGVLTVNAEYLQLPASMWTVWNNTDKAAFTDAAYLGRNIIACDSLKPNSTGIYVRGVDGRIRAVAPWAASCTSIAEFRTALESNPPINVVISLATTTTVQLSPTEVKTLLGNNSIFTDAGSVSVDYVADTKLYIDNKVAELQALILEN